MPQRLSITVSIGVATVADPGDAPPEVLIERAQRALTMAKDLGRNCVRSVGPMDSPFDAAAQ